MFRQCAGDAAPGSSQTALGSGSFLLAPLSNFRAGTLPTTVSLPHSHKPETDSLPACLATRSPSRSLSLPLCLFLSLSLFCSHSLFFCLLSQSFFFFLWLSFPELAPSSFPAFASFCAFRIIGLQSQSRSVNHVLPCHCVLSAAPPPSPVNCFLLFSRTHFGLVHWLRIPMLHFHFNCPTFAGPWDIFFCTYILWPWQNAPCYFWLDLTTNALHGPVHYQHGGVSLFK